MGMVAIITARGGSKRIPHKNIKEFCGKISLLTLLNDFIVVGII